MCSCTNSITATDACTRPDETSSHDALEEKAEAEALQQCKCHLTVGPELIWVEMFTSQLLQVTEKQNREKGLW